MFDFYQKTVFVIEENDLKVQKESRDEAATNDRGREKDLVSV